MSDDPLTNIRKALAGMTDAELGALHIAAEETTTGLASGLLAVIAHCCDWELHRRRGIDFALSGPHEAIDPEDVATSHTSLAVLGVTFHAKPRVRALLDAIGEAPRAPPSTMQ